MGSVVLSVVEEMRGMARKIYVYVGWLNCHTDVTIFARRRLFDGFEGLGHAPAT